MLSIRPFSLYNEPFFLIRLSFILMIDFYAAKVGRMQKRAVVVRLKELLLWGSNEGIDKKT